MSLYAFPRMRRVKHVHFVGIGGAGMCGIAEVLHHEGYRITGSDQANSKVIQHLTGMGITVFIGHDASHVDEADVVVCSTAIHSDNPEVIAAHQKHIPIIPRAAMLAELMRFRYGIAIAGTHGKTTTTSLVSNVLTEGGLDPSYVIGGKLNRSGTNAQLGKSPYLVVEADESDASFLFLKPMMAVVTNIDADHMSTYQHDFNRLKQTFIEFLHHLPFHGLAVVCIDDPEIHSLLPSIERPTVTYGFHKNAQYRASDWKQEALISRFIAHRPKPLPPLSIEFSSPGQHNVLNALAAIAIATELGVRDEAICKGLATFQGVGRRFQLLGEHSFKKGNALIIDDYGHHPREITATIEAFRKVWPQKKLIHVFQPHRYSRTQELFKEFIQALGLSDLLLLLDIYPAGEVAIPDINSAKLIEAIHAHRPEATLVTPENLKDMLNQHVTEGCAILMQGAGNITQLAQSLTAKAKRA